MSFKNIILVIFTFFTCVSCEKEKEMTLSGLNIRYFQTEVDGKLTNLYVLKNKNGMEACITNYGARLVSLMVPDRNGKFEDVVAGYSNIYDYMNQKQNFGATVGRYANRIYDATFTLDSITYHLTANNEGNCLHGGDPGFASQIWQAEQLDENALRLTLFSPDGDNGFPGSLKVRVIYMLTNRNELDIYYEAATDKPTVVNLSHHSFFNLSADFNTTVDKQLLYINASTYTPYDSLKRVSGEILSVVGTPFDFTVPHAIGERVKENNVQLTMVNGFDHNWVLNTKGNDKKLAARLLDNKSGRIMEVYTNEPGIQVYTANSLCGTITGKQKIAYQQRCAICLETQHFTDSPNKPQFPSTVLLPGEMYQSHCMYRFEVMK